MMRIAGGVCRVPQGLIPFLHNRNRGMRKRAGPECGKGELGTENEMFRESFLYTGSRPRGGYRGCYGTLELPPVCDGAIVAEGVCYLKLNGGGDDLEPPKEEVRCAPKDPSTNRPTPGSDSVANGDVGDER